MRRLRAGDEEGYLLIDLVAAFGVFAMVAAVCFPRVPFSPKRVGAEATGAQLAQLLRDARTTSRRQGTLQEIVFDFRRRAINAASRQLTFPVDIEMTYEVGPTCSEATLVFRPDGTSCGGLIRLARGDHAYEIRVNWVDSSIDLQAAP